MDLALFHPWANIIDFLEFLLCWSTLPVRVSLAKKNVNVCSKLLQTTITHTMFVMCFVCVSCVQLLHVLLMLLIVSIFMHSEFGRCAGSRAQPHPRELIVDAVRGEAT